jgi:hypothetical protein
VASRVVLSSIELVSYTSESDSLSLSLPTRTDQNEHEQSEIKTWAHSSLENETPKESWAKRESCRSVSLIHITDIKPRRNLQTSIYSDKSKLQGRISLNAFTTSSIKTTATSNFPFRFKTHKSTGISNVNTLMFSNGRFHVCMPEYLKMQSTFHSD